MATVTIKGTYYHRTGWVNSNWSRMLTAHDTAEPTALSSGLFDGTFNVQITEIAESQLWTAEAGNTVEDTFTVPAGVTEIQIECYGGGGNIDFPTNPGGGGGYARAKRAVTPGDEMTVEIFYPGTGPRVYEPTFLWSIEGGGNTGPLGVSGSIAIDDFNFYDTVFHKGGDSGSPNAGDPTDNGIGGGGGGAGSISDGANGEDASGDIGGAGGAGGGGLAGAGGKGADKLGEGDPGTSTGGGGGGGMTGVVGGGAAIIISWFTPASEWFPPSDDTYRQEAHDVGDARGNQESDGSNFLFRGNYIHPDVTVVTINDTSIPNGQLYYAGSNDSFTTGSPLEPGAISRHSLEILSSDDLAALLGVSEDDEVTVVLDDGT